MNLMSFARRAVLAATLLFLLPVSFAAEFVGSDTCSGCHQQESKDWQTSDHFKAMAVADEKSVLGDFSGISVNFHDIENRFYQKDGHYYIETLGKDNKRASFQILFTFGHFPLQQYLVDIGDGHIQALNTAWDSRSKEEGGQRWYHLQPNEAMTADNPFFWAGHFQNWNSRCADCHSTNLQKNYDPETHSYKTTWSEINVSCESCHGPGSEHISLAKNNKLSDKNIGLEYLKPENIRWLFDKDDPIAKAKGQKSNAHIDMCGGCHSRRMQLDDPNKFDDYHQKYQLQTLGEGLYFDDGQIQDEVYVLGSFMQSKMQHAGVTCMNCHNPHSGKLVAEPNQVCAQCHQPATYETPKHTLHKQGSEAAQCVSCHMPERTYMGVDDRRDHNFTIPNPFISEKTGAPNACVSCHEDKDNSWAIKALSDAGQKPEEFHWALLNEKARELNMLAIKPLSMIALDDTLPSLIRATFLEQLGQFPSRLAVEAAQKALTDSEALARRAAVRALAAVDPQVKWQSLYPLMKDPVRTVRFEVANSLADIYTQLPAQYQTELKVLLDEYRASLIFTQDFPGTQVALAHLERRLGRPAEANKAYEKALHMAPTFVPALLNLADYYRSTGESEKEITYIKRAIAVVPESAAVQHSMGLYWVRQKAYEKALPFLQAATGDSPDASPRFSYVYAVALDTLGQTKEAIRALQRSDKRWPNQYETLATLILYLEKTGNQASVYSYLSQISRIAPNSPQVKLWVEKYR